MQRLISLKYIVSRINSAVLSWPRNRARLLLNLSDSYAENTSGVPVGISKLVNIIGGQLGILLKIAQGPLKYYIWDNFPL